MANSFFNKRTTGVLELADRLYGHHLYECNVAQQFLSSDMARDRKRVLKPNIKLKEQAVQDEYNKEHNIETEVDIFLKNFIDSYYPNRPKELEKFSLYNIFSNFQ